MEKKRTAFENPDTRGKLFRENTQKQGDQKKHIAQNVNLTKKEVDKMVEMLFNTNKKSFK